MKTTLMSKIVPQLLALKSFYPNRTILLNEGSLKDRVEKGLDLLRNNKVSGEKVVVEIHA